MHLTHLMPPVVVLGIDQRHVATLHLASRHRRRGPHHRNSRRRRLRRSSTIIGSTPLVCGDPRRGVLEIVPLPELQAHQVWVWVEMRPIAAIERLLVMVVVVVLVIVLVVVHISSGLVREHQGVTHAGLRLGGSVGGSGGGGVVVERIAGAVPVKPGGPKVSNIPCKVAATITILPSVTVKRVPAIFHNSLTFVSVGVGW